MNLAPFVSCAALLAGCQATPKATPVPVRTAQTDVWRGDGTAASWDEMMADLVGADAVFLGEEHDDGAGHALQREIVEALLASWGGGALSLEMLERDEQDEVDLWMAGELTTAQLRDQTGSSGWCGPGSWDAWYQPILDAAIANGGVVVAANCPREHVRTALSEGYESLPGFDDPRRSEFDLPGYEHDDYRQSLRELMIGTRLGLAEDGDLVLVDAEEVDRVLRGQLVWDATMSRSAAGARGQGKVVHLAGHFHIDRHGGTVAEFRRLRPNDMVRTVTVRQDPGFVPGDDEIGAADWIVGSASAAASHPSTSR